MVAEQDVAIPVADATRLEGRLAVADHAAGGLVVCHPHPLYGGDMENPVVVRSAEVAREAGLATLRFNFRGVGRSTGVHGGGDAEQEDLRAALQLLRSRLPVGRPLGLAGYSFGAWVSARVAEHGSALAALCLIAPPVAMVQFGAIEAQGLDILIVAGSRDAYCPVPSLDALAGRIPGARTVVIDGADHFFFGKLYPLGEAVRAWITRWAAG